MRIYDSLGCLIKILLTFNSNRIRGTAAKITVASLFPPVWERRVILDWKISSCICAPMTFCYKLNTPQRTMRQWPGFNAEILTNADNSIIITKVQKLKRNGPIPQLFFLSNVRNFVMISFHFSTSERGLRDLVFDSRLESRIVSRGGRAIVWNTEIALLTLERVSSIFKVLCTLECWRFSSPSEKRERERGRNLSSLGQLSNFSRQSNLRGTRVEEKRSNK